MNSRQPRSWAATILGFSLMVLAACYALNLAARLLMDVLPVLVGLAAVAGLLWLGFGLLSRRNSGW